MAIFTQTKPLAKKIYRLIEISPRLIKIAIAKPKYIFLGLWAFKQLWRVDEDLQGKAIAALKTPSKNPLPPLDSELRKKIRERAIAIIWIAKIHPVRPKCLHCSLALYHWLIEQNNICPKLEVGWGNNIGHAWVTYDGIVLNDNPNIAESMIPFK